MFRIVARVTEGRFCNFVSTVELTVGWRGMVLCGLFASVAASVAFA